jgi:hypothetical protein
LLISRQYKKRKCMGYSNRDPDVKCSVHSSPDGRVFGLHREENSKRHGFGGASFVTGKWSPCLSDSDTTGGCNAAQNSRDSRGISYRPFVFFTELGSGSGSLSCCPNRTLPKHCTGPRRIIARIKASLGSALGSLFDLCLSHFSSFQRFFFHNRTKLKK